MSIVLVLNGPNLNLLGTRQPDVYGTTSLADVERMCHEEGGRLGVDIDFRQTNHEGHLIDWIQEAAAMYERGQLVGAVLNPGAFGHTSIALQDAIEAVRLPVVELHISNVYKREAVRHHSYISPVAVGIVTGFGVAGYPLAIRGLVAVAGPVDASG